MGWEKKKEKKWSPWYLHPKKNKTIQILEAMCMACGTLHDLGAVLIFRGFHGQTTPLVVRVLHLGLVYTLVPDLGSNGSGVTDFSTCLSYFAYTRYECEYSKSQPSHVPWWSLVYFLIRYIFCLEPVVTHRPSITPSHPDRHRYVSARVYEQWVRRSSLNLKIGSTVQTTAVPFQERSI